MSAAPTVGMNRAYLVGKLGAIPELRTTASGLPHARMSIATTSARKVDGEWIDSTDWHRLSAFGDIAEHVVKHGVKGATIAVEATIRPNRWTDAQGCVHYDVALHVERIVFLGGVQ